MAFSSEMGYAFSIHVAPDAPEEELDASGGLDLSLITVPLGEEVCSRLADWQVTANAL